MSVLADFECPMHGRFEARGEDSAPCPHVVLHKAGCDPGLYGGTPCGQLSPWAPSPVRSRVKLGEVMRGKSDERPPETYCMDTRPLADGMPVSEWRAKQLAINHDIAIKKARAKL